MVTSTKSIHQYTPLFSVCSVHEMGRATDTRRHPCGLKPLICEQINRGTRREDKHKEWISASSQWRTLIKKVKSKRQMIHRWLRLLTSLSRLVPAAVVGRSSGLYGLKRALNTSETPRVDLVIPAGLSWPQPWKTCNYRKHGHPVVMDLNGFGCRKRRKHAVLLRLCESFAPHYQRDCVLRRSEATMLKGDSTKSYGQRYLWWQ